MKKKILNITPNFQTNIRTQIVEQFIEFNTQVQLNVFFFYFHHTKRNKFSHKSNSEKK